MDEDVYSGLIDAFAGLDLIKAQEFGAVQPCWAMSIDPQTGVGVFTFRPELLLRRREIEAMSRVIEAHLHDLALKLAEARAIRTRQ